ncbi:MOB kinase activator 3A [Tachysurus ichikawai]
MTQAFSSRHLHLVCHSKPDASLLLRSSKSHLSNQAAIYKAHKDIVILKRDQKISPYGDRPRPSTPFPKSFMQVAKKILSRLFRVFVHVYIHHFDRVSQMGAEAHVNTCYKHFYYFVTELNLIDHKELEPLKEMTSRMCH